MKIYAIADIHGSQYRLNLVLKNIERFSPDICVVCGDITQFGPADVARNFLDQIPIETLAITGNIDTLDVNNGIDESKAIKIERKKVIKKGIPFIGISCVDETQISHFFSENKNIVDEKSVLVTHVPPFETQDKIFMGRYGGSKELKSIVEKYNPRLVLSGHIHENPGFSKVGNTIVVNCSMGKRGEGAIIDINSDISVKMLD